MSAARDALKRASAAGITLTAEGSRLSWRASAEPPAELLDELRAHKPALLQLLTQPDEEAPAPEIDRDDPAERISASLAAVDHLPKACGPHGQRLKAITTDFALGCWAYKAVQLGWTDADLFAIDGGLIPEMSQRALHFRSIGEDAISLINGRGAFEEWPRRDMTDAVPWWEDERCVARPH
jgi:hypothetical protein